MPAALKPDEVLHGRYRIRERIGQGGMGNIYLADDLRLEGRKCALKEVEHDRSVPANLLKEARQQFRREATVLARLDHPNLPKVSDFFAVGVRDYLVMDYIPGKDLRTLMLDAKQNNSFLTETDALLPSTPRSNNTAAMACTPTSAPISTPSAVRFTTC
ncbi:MAG: protein kinase [Chloroflexi bacterium]|nr:protein kinase [Chloroflexota bacterium]